MNKDGRKKRSFIHSGVYDIVIWRPLRRAEDDRLIGLGAFLHFRWVRARLFSLDPVRANGGNAEAGR